jgi:phosphopantothenoylcysteine decarboxylase/phosphopantothenate--cysteine ligase
MAYPPIEFPRGRELVLGVGASIAAYKSCDLLRRVQELGFNVTVIPTETSLRFVGKATWEALSGKKVSTSLWDDVAGVSHTKIGESADVVLIAPATGDLIARLAHGQANDLLTTTVLASNCQKILVPAMHPLMWLNSATVENISTLRKRGFLVLEPEVGKLSGNDYGIGRFPEISTILDQLKEVTGKTGDFIGKKILITTGGTREAIDPVRFIGNRSSGAQGLAIAYEALSQGAEVTLLVAETAPFSLPGAEVIATPNVEKMEKALKEEFPKNDVLIMAAAVSDARPKYYSPGKIKKDQFSSIELETNPDLLSSVAVTKRTDQFILGFAAETGSSIVELGMAKLERKRVDALYVTDVTDGKVFGEKITTGALLSKKGIVKQFDKINKYEVAREILAHIRNSVGNR